MALTNQQMKLRVRAGLGRGDARSDQDDNIVQSINDALLDLVKDVSYPELKQYPREVSTVAAQPYVALSAIITAGSHQSYDKVDQVFALHAIDGTSYYPLTGLPERVFVKSFPINAATDNPARPTHYTILKDRLYLYPTPDAIYTLQVLYSLWPTPIQHASGVITSGSDPGQQDAELPLSKSDHCIFSGAMYWAYMTLGNTDKMKMFFPIFEKQKMQDKKKYGQRLDYYPSGDSWGFTNRQGVAPSEAAQEGTTSYDGTIISTPIWD
jgi:hypothetical protein